MAQEKIKTADIAITITMEREYVSEDDQKTHWNYYSRIVSDEFGEILDTFSARSLQSAIQKAVEVARGYVADESVSFTLNRNDCGERKFACGWAQINICDYAKCGRIADYLFEKVSQK